MVLKLPQRCSLQRARAAAAGEIPTHRCELIKEVRVRSCRLEVITPPVRNDSTIENVQLTDHPAVEPRFAKCSRKQGLVADLHITHTCPKPSDIG